MLEMMSKLFCGRIMSSFEGKTSEAPYPPPQDSRSQEAKKARS